MLKPAERRRIKADLASKQGGDLVNAIADELADLHAQMAQIEERLRLFPIFQDFNGRLGVLAEHGLDQEALPDKLRIEASHLLAADGGFYGIEYDSAGRAFRWTGPRRDFYFVLYLDRRAPLYLELELLRTADSNIQKDIMLLADGKPVPLQLESARTAVTACATLPPLASPRATSLIFVVPTLVPETDGLNVRQLGVAFREIRLQPTQPPAGEEVSASNSRESFERDAVSWLMAPDFSPSCDPTNATAMSLSGDHRLHDRQRDRGAALDVGGSNGHFPRIVRIDADNIEDGTAGFFPLETDQFGHSYRWTGPGKTFAFTVRVDRSCPLSVKLCFVRFVSSEKQAPVTVRIGEAERALELRNSADGIVGRTILPAVDIASATTLTFAVQSVLRPGNADRRSLGIAFRYLVLEPASRTHTLDIGGLISNATTVLGRTILRAARRFAPTIQRTASSIPLHLEFPR